FARAFRGMPWSISITRRRARPSTSAALSPAGPPPTITTSYMPPAYGQAQHSCIAKPTLFAILESRVIRITLSSCTPRRTRFPEILMSQYQTYLISHDSIAELWLRVEHIVATNDVKYWYELYHSLVRVHAHPSISFKRISSIAEPI